MTPLAPAQAGRRNRAERLRLGGIVGVAASIGTVHLAGLVVGVTGWGGPLGAYASIADHFEVLGYAVAGTLLLAGSGGALSWKFGEIEERYA